MLNKNVMTFIGCDAEYNESEIVLFGAPFDSTTSYRPGQDLEVRQFAMSLMDWKLTVRIREKI